jgi:hypothetical protein
MGAWPFVEVEVETENLPLQEPCDVNALEDEVGHNSLEEVDADKVVLVLANVVYDVAHCPDLVVFERIVDGRPVKVLAGVVRFLNFVFVEDRELCLEKVFVLVRKQVLHRSRVK